MGPMPTSPRGLTIVTAADETYGRCVEQLLLSLVRVYRGAPPRTHVWDLGLSPARARAIDVRFGSFAERKRFDFDAHPPHLRIRERLHNNNGWKPPAIRQSASELTGVLLWLDSATVLVEDLYAITAFTKHTGLYTPFGGAASVEELTHPLTLERMQASPTERAARQRHSGTVGLNLDMPFVRALLDRWCEAALDPGLICPEGSSHLNHRFDQSLWNMVLAHAARDSAAADGGRRELQLTLDEIDVSSADPVTSYRTRNKVPSYVPLAADPVLRVYFALRRRIDVAVLRSKVRVRGTSSL